MVGLWSSVTGNVFKSTVSSAPFVPFSLLHFPQLRHPKAFRYHDRNKDRGE